MEPSYRDEDGRGIPPRRNGGLTLQLTAPFALQLQELFGSVGYNIDSAMLLDDDLAILVDFGVAESIHAAWIRGFLQPLGADYTIHRKEVEAAAVEIMDDGRGVPLEFLKNGVKLSLDLPFALQLIECFGSEGCHHERESDLIMSVSIELAKELHTALGRNFMQNVEKQGLFYLFTLPDEYPACQQQPEGVQYEDEFEEVEECLEEDSPAEKQELDGVCVCGNTDERRFWKIPASPPSEEELFGVCCMKKSCQKEYLTERFCQEEIKTGESIMWCGTRLWMKKQLEPEYPDGCEETLGREPVQEVSCLQRGDHITWRRKLGYWHHGVVTEIIKDEDKFEIMHWSNLGKSLRMKIKKETKTKADLEGAYRVNYINIYHGAGDFWNKRLAVARAYSRRHKIDVKGRFINIMTAIGDFNTDYVLFYANCEHFATYCVLGKAICYQSLRNVLLGARKGRKDSSENLVIDDGIRKLTGASGMMLLRGICLVKSFWEKRHLLGRNKITEDAFKEDINQQINVFSGGGGLEGFKRAASCFGSTLHDTFKSCAAVLSQVI